MMYHAWIRPGSCWRRRLEGGVLDGEGKETYVAKDAEEDVDDGVGRANTALYPDCRHGVAELAILECCEDGDVLPGS